MKEREDKTVAFRSLDKVGLSPEEAIHLAERGKIIIVDGDRRMELKELFCNFLSNSKLENRYIAYRDLRERGYYLEPMRKEDGLRLYQRGKKPPDRSRYIVKVLSEQEKISISDIVDEIEIGRNTRKDVILAIVDDEGEVTFYEAKYATFPTEKSDLLLRVDKVARANLLHEKVLLQGDELSKELYEKEWFGDLITIGGDLVLWLSLIEAVYLVKKEIIEVYDGGRKLLIDDILTLGSRRDHRFIDRCRVYEDMRDRGLVVKTGFKFGSHFRVYENKEELMGDRVGKHSRYLVHVISRDHVFLVPEVSRAVRLAQNVRKRMIFAYIDENNDIRYVDIGRKKL